jgi:hypothetical protein
MTSTTSPSARQTVLAAFGVASVVLGVAVVVGVTPARILGPVADLDPTQATGLLGVLLVGYALRRRRQNDDRPGPTRLRDVGESAGPPDPGEAVDTALQDIEAASTAFATREEREQVRDVVWRTAVRAYAQRHGVSRTAATDAVAAGDWTDDVVAAAFVGDDRAPRLPLRERLRGWLHPNRAFRRRAERAASAVHRFTREVAR